MQIKDLIPWARKDGAPDAKSSEDNPMATLQREMNHVFENFWNRVGQFEWPWGSGEAKSDVVETDNAIEVSIELPGMEMKDIEARPGAADADLPGRGRVDICRPRDTHHHRVDALRHRDVGNDRGTGRLAADRPVAAIALRLIRGAVPIRSATTRPEGRVLRSGDRRPHPAARRMPRSVTTRSRSWSWRSVGSRGSSCTAQASPMAVTGPAARRPARVRS